MGQNGQEDGIATPVTDVTGVAISRIRGKSSGTGHRRPAGYVAPFDKKP